MSNRPADPDKFRGCLLGAAIGDALGAPYEHQTASVLMNTEIEAYGVGIYGHEPGGSTDDTTLTRFHAEGWIEGKGVKGHAYSHYVNSLMDWYETGPKDMGGQTRAAIESHMIHCPVKDTGSCGNGSLMAVSPAGLVARSPQEAGKLAHEFSGLTHPNELCRYICGQFAASIYALTRDYGNREYWNSRVTVPSWMPVDGASQGYVAVTAGLAYNALAQSAGFEAFDVLCNIIRMGGDTDTNASVTGALLGAAYGSKIWQYPEWLLKDLVDYQGWIKLADELFELAMKR